MRRGLMGWNAAGTAGRGAGGADRAAARRDGEAPASMRSWSTPISCGPAPSRMLTGFTPYWSEGLLLVPLDGQPVFATALSNRVADWIRSTNPVSEIVNTPRPGTLLGERLIQHAGAKRVGVLELDAMPSELADDLAAAAPAVEWVDGSALFTAIRRVIDAERVPHADARSWACGQCAWRGEHRCRPRTPARLPAKSRSTRGSPAPKKSISRSRPTLRRTAGSIASRSRCRWRSASRFAPRLLQGVLGPPHRAPSPRTIALRTSSVVRALARGIELGRHTAGQLAEIDAEISGAS